MDDLRCLHSGTVLVRVICRDGREHLAERCLVCGQNVRGDGKWVPRAECPEDAKNLPVWKDLRSAEDKGEQGTLF